MAMIDADKMSVQERLDQINKELASADLAQINPDENIAIFVPKRNAATRNVDEAKAYPKLRNPSSCKREVDSYINTICKTGLPHDALSSLIHACDELRKIL